MFSWATRPRASRWARACRAAAQIPFRARTEPRQTASRNRLLREARSAFHREARPAVRQNPPAPKRIAAEPPVLFRASRRVGCPNSRRSSRAARSAHNFRVDPRISLRTKRSTTAPMKATKIVPPMPPMGVEMPSLANSQPPMKAPTMPMTMSPMIPYPVPPITRDARTPATRPTTIQATIPIVSVLERLLRHYGAARQIVASDQASLLAQDTRERWKHQQILDALL